MTEQKITVKTELPHLIDLPKSALFYLLLDLPVFIDRERQEVFCALQGWKIWHMGEDQWQAVGKGKRAKSTSSLLDHSNIVWLIPPSARKSSLSVAIKSEEAFHFFISVVKAEKHQS